MKYYLFILLLIAGLGLMSCDRFDHNFVPDEQDNFETELFTPLENDFNMSTAADLSPAMAHYADDYQHFGYTKNEWQIVLESILAGVADPQFEVSFTNVQQQNDTEALASWRLKISDPATRTVLADSIYTAERLRKVGDKWLLRGNQNACNPVNKQLVIAQYFTFDTCPSCPASEAKLHDLELQYPGQFIYLEHHIMNELHLTHDNTNMYYNVFSAPTAVFQGQEKVSQSNDVSLALYQSNVDALAQIDEPIRYQLQSVNLSGRDLNAQVRLLPQINLDQTDLVLNYVLIEETSDHTNANGDPLHNVVRALGSQSLSTADLNNPIDISLTSTVDLPTDLKLVVFAQHKPTPFANNSTIYGGLVHSFSRLGR